MKNEPVITAGLLVAFVAGTLSLLRAFGVKLGQEQADALLNLAGLVAPFVVPLVAAVWVRGRVDGPATAAAKTAVIERFQRNEQRDADYDAPDKTSSKRGLAALLVFALVLPAGPVGCAAVPTSVVAALPAIFSALGTAEAAVNTFEAWAERFKGAPGVTPELLEQIHGLSQECRQSFAQARRLARNGAESEEQAKAALNQGLDTFEALKATLASAGLFGEGRLLAPAAVRSLERPDELAVPLPPRRL